MSSLKRSNPEQADDELLDYAEQLYGARARLLISKIRAEEERESAFIHSCSTGMVVYILNYTIALMLGKVSLPFMLIPRIVKKDFVDVQSINGVKTIIQKDTDSPNFMDRMHKLDHRKEVRAVVISVTNTWACHRQAEGAMASNIKNGYSIHNHQVFCEVLPCIVTACGIKDPTRFVGEFKSLYIKEMADGKLDIDYTGNGVAFQIFMSPEDRIQFSYNCGACGSLEKEPEEEFEDQSRIFCDFELFTKRCRTIMYPWKSDFEEKLEPFIMKVKDLLTKYEFDETVALANVC